MGPTGTLDAHEAFGLLVHFCVRSQFSYQVLGPEQNEHLSIQSDVKSGPGPKIPLKEQTLCSALP